MRNKAGFFLLSVVCMIIATGCVKLTNSTMYFDEGIDADIREEIAALDDSLIKSIKNGDTETIMGMTSCKFASDGAAVWVNTVSELVKDGKTAYIGRYYASVDKPDNQIIVMNPTQDVPYYVSTQAYANQIFVSLVSVTTDLTEYMLSFTYVMEEGVWKIISLYVGEYKVHGMSAVDLYEKAVKLYDDNMLLPSAMYAGLCNNMIRPSSAVQFRQEAEMTAFIKKVAKEVEEAHTIPLKLSDTHGVEVYSIELIHLREGLIPSIKYITETDLDQAEEIQREANEIHKELIALFDGMDESFEVFLYKAFAEPPLDPGRKYRVYTTMIE